MKRCLKGYSDAFYFFTLCDAYIHVTEQGFEGQGGMSKQGFEGQGERRRRARLCKPRWGEEINMCSNMQKISANICAK